MYEISKKFRFEAAHHLPHLPEGHKCSRPHGHSYEVDVSISTEELDKYDFVLDYGELDTFKQWLNDTCDHRDLNVILDPYPTTAENLARFFYTQIDRIIREKVDPERYEKLELSVGVSETENTWATYTLEEEYDD